MTSAGTRLQGQVRDSQSIVVTSAASLDDLRGSGALMVTLGAARSGSIESTLVREPRWIGATATLLA